MRNKEGQKDLLVVALFLALSFVFFWPQTVGGKTMLPADNVFAFPPWSDFAVQAGVNVPHNDLLSDLILQNYVWKQFTLDSVRAGQVPLWNPYIVGGMPFLADGQHSMMYPFSIPFYILPLANAYGWYALLHTFFAGLFMYILARTLKAGRLGSIVAGTTFMFSGFMFIHNVFPMIEGAVVWLPLILAMIERIAQRVEQYRFTIKAILPSAIIGTICFAMVILAGHPEMYYYIGLTALFYAVYRLTRMAITMKKFQPVLATAASLAFMALLGVGIGSAQWVPLLELVRHNFREGSNSFTEVRSWAWPWRQVFAMFMPDIYGNPTHHTFFNLFTWRTEAITKNLVGGTINNPNWGMKNYVEAAGFLGLLPTLLAAIGLLRRKGMHLGFFAGLAFVSILFVFGSPLYILVYRLPGLSQVHSPFRWIFPYTLCMSVVAGMGMDRFWEGIGEAKTKLGRLLDRFSQNWIPWLILVGGVLGLGALGVTFIIKDRLLDTLTSAIDELAMAPYAFDGPQMFYSFLVQNFAQLGIVMVLSGAVLLLRKKFKRPYAWLTLVLLVAVGEMYYYEHDFFPAADPKLIAYKTPVIDFLKNDTSLYRITSFDPSGPPTLIANAGWFYNIQDVRGYDSIILKSYVDYMKLIETQPDLLYNRIGGIKNIGSPSSPLLDLLNVKYVLTNKDMRIGNRNYTLVYDAEVKVYSNDDFLPRAFLVPNGLYISDPEARAKAMRTIVPYDGVMLEQAPPPHLDGSIPVPSGFLNDVTAITYSANEVLVRFSTPISAYLVLGDTYFDGWKAFIRPVDEPNPSLVETSITIQRAYGTFRAVEVPAGTWEVRFKYTPDSVKYGLYITFMSAIILLLLIGYWGWRRFFRQPQDDEAARRVTKNTVAPIVLNVVNKLIDMVFAMLMLRVLGPADAGQYYLAVVVIGWFDILTNFGLNTFLTRDVARDRSSANKYLANTIVMRMSFCLLSVPVLAGFILLRRISSPLEPRTILAIVLFGLALVPSNISASISAVFMAYERMELPAFIATVTTVFRALVGAVALLMGTGFIGLASISIVTNLITVAIFYILLRRFLFNPKLEFDWAFQKQMLRDSYPLMVNSLLATLFFKVAVLLLEWQVRDTRVVGWYSTAYKYIDAVGIIPAFFTMAIFPLMSRYAAESKESLFKAYRLAIKLLLSFAFPGALLGWALSYPLISILGGSQYLPYSAQILGIMVWYMPFGFINSVTQYVLIALNKQRFLTGAFAIGLAFNLIANILLIRRYGYIASAYITVASEFVLLVPFYIGIRRHLAKIPWLELLWKPIASVIPLALLLVLLPNSFKWLGIIIGLVFYMLLVTSLEVFNAEERSIVDRVLPISKLRDRLLNLLPFTV
ncbi:MAG: oligosaccharide flippase family protein [Anaerolineae bacterium]